MASFTNQDIQNFFAANPNMPADQVSKLMYEYGVSPAQVAEATGRGLGYVSDTYNQSIGMGSGLKPAVDTLNRGAAEATNRIGQTSQKVTDLYNQGTSYIAPYMSPGESANNLQAALSGAMGPEAQQQAFAQYQQSPGVKFAQGEAERALTRNAAATGGLGGGNVLRDLTQLAAGTFMQDFGNQYSRLGEIANRGYGAATTGAGMQGQQAGIQSSLGQFAANIPMNTAGAQSGIQFQAGRDVGSAIQGTTSALSSLINQQGAGMTDITGNATTNLNSLYQNAMSGDATAKEQLAAMLGNLSTGSASMVGNQPIIQGQQTNYLGQLGQVASGLGGLYAGMNSGDNPTTQPTTYRMPAATQEFFGLVPGGSARFSSGLGDASYGPYSTVYGGYR